MHNWVIQRFVLIVIGIVKFAMSAVDLRKEIAFLASCGHKAGAIQKILIQQHGDSAPSLSTVYKWMCEVRWGNKKMEDAPRSGRPNSAVTERNIDLVEKLVGKNPKISARVLAERLAISRKSVKKILSDHLDMTKMNCRWVPKTLNQRQLRDRITSCRHHLSVWKDHWGNLIDRIVTSDETWVQYENIHDRISGAEWRKRGSNPPELPKIKNNPKKMMATVFWDNQGVLLMDILPKGQTVTGEYYANLLTRLNEKIKEKRRGKLRKGVILLHDNARVHTAKIVADRINGLKWTIFEHPPYSPDLAPSDYYLFRNLKNHLKGKVFDQKEHLEQHVIEYFEEKSSEFFTKPFVDLKERMQRCIELKGHYLP